MGDRLWSQAGKPPLPGGPGAQEHHEQQRYSGESRNQQERTWPAGKLGRCSRLASAYRSVKLLAQPAVWPGVAQVRHLAVHRPVSIKSGRAFGARSYVPIKLLSLSAAQVAIDSQRFLNLAVRH